MAQAPLVVDDAVCLSPNLRHIAPLNHVVKPTRTGFTKLMRSMSRSLIASAISRW
jgi:hypothetical protein